MNYLPFLLPIWCLVVSCTPNQPAPFTNGTPVTFDSTQLVIKTGPYKPVRGQLIYLPVYSNIPYVVSQDQFVADMTAFAAIHNTDLSSSITLTQVLYFDNDGKPVHDFLKGTPRVVPPLATVDFPVPLEDKSGAGANFLIEWVATDAVNEPLIESITAKMTTNQSTAFANQGKIIREIR